MAKILKYNNCHSHSMNKVFIYGNWQRKKVSSHSFLSFLVGNWHAETKNSICFSFSQADKKACKLDCGHVILYYTHLMSNKKAQPFSWHAKWFIIHQWIRPFNKIATNAHCRVNNFFTKCFKVFEIRQNGSNFSWVKCASMLLLNLPS